MASSLLRASLRPLSALFGVAVARRNARFDATAGERGPIPALSVGNLTVGGTGKTPVASWFARTLHQRGARPALVLRGYGDDEWRVHQLLAPEVPVIVSPDRRQALVEAAAGGADCVVLDDAFQHRRAPRVSDVVLISADRWTGSCPLLPVGPFREPLAALRRATAVVVTVKAAPAEQVEAACRAVAAAVPPVPVAVVRLVPDALHRVREAGEGESLPVAALRDRRIGLVSAIADPAALERQLRASGARITHHARFPDHHAFAPVDVARMAPALRGVDLAVCTLKDAVKLAALWPRATTPLWYVSQTLVVDRGAEVLDQECNRVLVAR